MLTWKTKNRTPGGGWRYFQKETNTTVTGPHWGALLDNVRKHREANELPIDPGLEREVEDFMCAEMPDGCREVESQPAVSINIGTAFEFTKILAETFFRGNERVEQAEADRRAKICAHCPDNIEATGCRPCKALNIEKFVLKLTGNKSTRADAKLDSCRHCGCFNKVQVWFPLDILQKNQREVVRDALPSNCWKK